MKAVIEIIPVSVVAFLFVSEEKWKWPKFSISQFSSPFYFLFLPTLPLQASKLCHQPVLHIIIIYDGNSISIRMMWRMKFTTHKSTRTSWSAFWQHLLLKKRQKREMKWRGKNTRYVKHHKDDNGTNSVWNAERKYVKKIEQCIREKRIQLFNIKGVP